MPRRFIALLAACGAPLGGCGDGVQRTTVTYDARHGDFGTLDLYQPLPGGSAQPAVVMVHPGGWTSESKADLAPESSRLAQSGYVVANINYRLAPAALWPAPLQDVWCALAWLRANAAALDVDGSRVALLGYSAGGQLVEMVGLEPPGITDQDPACPNGPTDRPAAVVSGDGPADLLGLPSEGQGNVTALLGCSSPACSPQSDPAIYAAASPISWAAPGAPPYLLVHGTGDAEVPWQQSQQLGQELADEGDSATLLLIQGAGHQFNASADLGSLQDAEYTIDDPGAWTAIVSFLDHTIGPPRR